MKPEMGVYRDGLVHVQAERCTTCIFRPGGMPYLEPGKVKSMVDQCLSDPTEGGNIPCHETLAGPRAICRGYWDGYALRLWRFRLAVAMDVVEEVR